MGLHQVYIGPWTNTSECNAHNDTKVTTTLDADVKNVDGKFADVICIHVLCYSFTWSLVWY